MANRTSLVGFEPLSEAVSVETVRKVARERCDFIVFLELFLANAAGSLLLLVCLTFVTGSHYIVKIAAQTRSRHIEQLKRIFTMAISQL